MKWNVSTKISLGYILALIILLIIGIVSYQSIKELNSNASLVNFTHEELKELDQVLFNLLDMETGERGYVITGQEQFLEPYESGAVALEADLKIVKGMIKENPSLMLKFETLESLVNQEKLILENIISIRKNEGFEKANKEIALERGKKVMDEIRVTIEDMENELLYLLEERSVKSRESAIRSINVIVYGVPMAFLVLGLISFFITRNISKPLQESIEIANKISEGDLSSQVSFVERNDEIGVLAKAFKKMIESLNRSSQVANKIALGDLTASASPKSKKDVMGNALQEMIVSLKHMADISDKIAAGDLSVDVTPKSEKDIMGNAFKEMINSLREMADVTKQVASGDLSVVIIPKSEDDVMGNALVTMVASLESVTREIVDGVNVLSLASSEIMASTTQVASAASETASAISETTTSVEEVKQSSMISSEKANAVSDATQDTVDIAETGIKAVDDSIDGMAQIQDQVETIAQSLVQLSEQSQTIGEIITSVNDLAEQSNLLAVNAAIEAAKAGEQGKGFAVVAQEVKILAEQSKEATSQVRSILNDIMKATNSAVVATEQGNKVVEMGVKQSHDAGDTIRQMVEHVDKAAEIALQIAISSKQQSTGMDQVAMAMENIRRASEQNVLGTKRVESTVQNLHELGQRLKNAVDQFKFSE